jgi:hypothetical protein
VSFARFAEFCSPLLELDIRAWPIQELLDCHRVLLILFLEQLRKWRERTQRKQSVKLPMDSVVLYLRVSGEKKALTSRRLSTSVPIAGKIINDARVSDVRLTQLS